jgi:FKBP-type peptidyl-prolyl cis-trans isomerase
MKPMLPLLALAGLLGLAACAPSEPPAPPVPEKSRAELQRVEFFGAEVAADPAVTWRPSGLGVKILVPGEGLTPQLSDRVRVNYSGRLKDGTVFNESAPDKPLEFKLGEMISGMTAGIAALKPGGRAILYVPPSLGYGSARVGKIPPVSGLIFEVELLAVVP